VESIPPTKGSPLVLSLIIPTYNEAQNIGLLIERLTSMLDRFYPDRYELIVVDDDSKDLTWQVAAQYQTQYSQLRVIRRCHEQGLSTAVIRGWQAAQGEFLGVIDGDLQHPPEILLKLIEAMATGADLAMASRHISGGGVSQWSFSRRFLSRGAQLLGLMILPHVVGRVSDPMSGYFLVTRNAIASQPLQPIGYKILIEVLGRGHINHIVEVPYVFQERGEGESKVTMREYINYLRHLLRLRCSRSRDQKR
jgi:dolichol-phosphate mannosyltransferase